MVKVSIEGRAGKSLGKKWKLHVGTVGEAINAIRANVGERFASQMGLMSHYVLVVDGALIPNESWFFKKIKQNLKIIPILAGGAIFLPVYYALASVFIGALTQSLIIAGFLAITIMAAVVALVYLGLSALISNMSEDPKDPKGERTSSFLFGGAENTASQGGVVPVAYGRLRVGSIALSVSSSSVDKAIWDKTRSSNSMIFG